MQLLRQQEADHVEVLVVVGGEPVRVVLETSAGVHDAPHAPSGWPTKARGRRVRSASACQPISRDDSRLQSAATLSEAEQYRRKILQRLFGAARNRAPKCRRWR